MIDAALNEVGHRVGEPLIRGRIIGSIGEVIDPLVAAGSRLLRVSFNNLDQSGRRLR